MLTAWIGSIVFSFAAVLYILLVLGLPYGEFAMGGKYKVMPPRMRVICSISIIIQIIGILALLEAGNVILLGLPVGVVRGVCYFFAIYLALNGIACAVSKSIKEKIAMTPLSLITSMCFLITAINT